MIDFNHQTKSDRINAAIDKALQAQNARQVPRNYLGGSRVGVSCERALQFEYFKAEKDSGREFSGQTLRIFAVGHCLEDLAVKWFLDAGFNLRTHGSDGKQFGFAVAGGRVKGHCDGVFVGGPPIIEYPALWECKTMNAEKWKAFSTKGVAESHPVYYAQVNFYMHHFNLTDNPAILTGINKDNQSLHHEIIKFNPDHAQTLINKAARIIKACEAGEPLPRVAKSADWFECKWCDYHQRCWAMEI